MAPLAIRASTSFMPKAEALGDQTRPYPRRGSGVRADFDFVPVCTDAEEQVTFFVLAESVISVWTKHWERATRKSGRSYLKGAEWEHQATFGAPFVEPFHLAAAEGAYFLVTDESGEVYAAEEVDGQWETRTVWKDRARPIVAMLTSGDGSAPFVFGKDFYFQLARKVEPQPCKDVTQGRPDLGDPMRTVLECAQVLHKAGLLNDTKPPE